MRGRHVLLVNPWIYDFAAYDLWAKPLGLLSLGAVLRRNGCQITLLDCLAGEQPSAKAYGQGKYRREIVEKPAALRGFPRHYARYGMSRTAFLARVRAMKPPDAVLVTSLMTYWYPGVFEAIKLIKEVFPASPVVLGGIYATLCHAHAVRYAGADCVIAGEGESAAVQFLADLWGEPPRYVPDLMDLDSLPYPCFDLQEGPRYGCIQTTRGCPYRCTYCAAHMLAQGVRHRDPVKVVDEIAFWQARGVRDMAIYDDALLDRPGTFAVPLLQAIVQRGLGMRFHCPNALHARAISTEVAHLMKAAGFVTLRLGLETADPGRQQETGGKVTTADFVRAVENLRRAGYGGEDIGVYLLCGMPFQEAQEVETAVDFVRECGARPVLAEYSPIPGTALWDDALRGSPFPLEEEPLYQNNTLLPCRWEGLTYARYQRIKQECRRSFDVGKPGN